MEEKGGTKTGIAYYDKNGVVQSVNETTGKPRSEQEKNLTEVEFKYNNLDDMFDKAQTAATAHKNLLANPPPTMKSPAEIEAAIAERLKSAPKTSPQPPQPVVPQKVEPQTASQQQPKAPAQETEYTALYNIENGELLGIYLGAGKYLAVDRNDDNAPMKPVQRITLIAPHESGEVDFKFSGDSSKDNFMSDLRQKAKEKIKENMDPRPQAQPPQPVVQQKVAPQPAQPATTSTSKPAVDNASNSASTGNFSSFTFEDVFEDFEDLEDSEDSVIVSPNASNAASIGSSSPRTSDSSSVLSSKSGVSGGAKASVSKNGYYELLDKKFADINSALKDCTLVKENGTYHIKNATTKSDIAINRDGSMRGELHTVNNQDDSKAIADKISADLVAMAKVHQASGSKEPFHLVVTKSENLSEAQELKVMQIERLVQHNLEREFNAGNKNGLDKSKFTFAGKPIPPPAPSPPVVQKAAIAARGNTTPKRDDGIRPHK